MYTEVALLPKMRNIPNTAKLILAESFFEKQLIWSIFQSLHTVKEIDAVDSER